MGSPEDTATPASIGARKVPRTRSRSADAQKSAQLPEGIASVGRAISRGRPRRTHEIGVYPQYSIVFGNARPAAGGPPPLPCARSRSPPTPTLSPTRKPPSTRFWCARSPRSALRVRRAERLTGDQVPGKVRPPAQRPARSLRGLADRPVNGGRPTRRRGAAGAATERMRRPTPSRPHPPGRPESHDRTR